MPISDADGANERASTQQRERMLRLWKWMGDGKEADIHMFSDVRVRAKVLSVDGSRQEMLVEKLETPMGTVPNAILRGSDLVSVCVQGSPVG